MKLFIFSDIHQDWLALEKILQKKADVFICLGDLSKAGEGLEQAGEKLAVLGEKLWLMPGNNETSEQTGALCRQYGFTHFHQQIFQQGKYNLVGLGYSNISPFKMPGEVSEEQLAKWLSGFRDNKELIFFTHVPPKNSQLDILPSGIHVGSTAVRDFIEKNSPLYHFSGHIHENAGKVEKIGKTNCYSVGKQGLEFNLPSDEQLA